MLVNERDHIENLYIYIHFYIYFIHFEVLMSYLLYLLVCFIILRGVCVINKGF